MTPAKTTTLNTKPKSKPKGKSSPPVIQPDKRIELLLEIGSEEIPAGMLPRAVDELKTILERNLVAENLHEGVTVETFGGPRRLTAWVRGLVAKQVDMVNEITGPPKSVAYDNAGAPTRAAVSFAEKQGVALHELFTVQTPKGEYLAVRVTRRGRTAHDLLLDILPRAIHDLTWPRTMTWTGLDGARFIRPIRWLVGVLDGEPVKFIFGGLTAGDTTRGHRFLGKPDIRVRDFADYEKKLRANGVIVRPNAWKLSFANWPGMQSAQATKSTRMAGCCNWSAT